jgi:hypothetical protein
VEEHPERKEEAKKENLRKERDRPRVVSLLRPREREKEKEHSPVLPTWRLIRPKLRNTAMESQILIQQFLRINPNKKRKKKRKKNKRERMRKSAAKEISELTVK